MKNKKKAGTAEDYWKLIGEMGVLQQDPYETSAYASFSQKPRVLVKFDRDLESLGLITHNNIGNSLWILVSDLESIETNGTTSSNVT